MSESSLPIENPRPSRAWMGHPRFFVALAWCLLVAALADAQESVGIFENHSDVGTVLHAGTATYDPAKQTYTLTGSGENMWAAQDAFQFAWKKVSGDVELTADISFANSAGNPHKKAVLMFRQSLDTDSVYVDLALHDSGLLALQYRDEKGAITREIQSNISPGFYRFPKRTPLPWRFRLTRRGKDIYVTTGESYGTPQHDGETIRIPLEGEFYAGIGVCAHDKDAVEQAMFSNVQLRNLKASTGTPVLFSTLETVSTSATDRQVIYFAQDRFEAPNWSRDGSYLLFNRNGHLEKLPVAGGIPQVLNTGSATHLNNDHGISPDATQLAISDNSQETKSATG